MLLNKKLQALLWGRVALIALLTRKTQKSSPIKVGYYCQLNNFFHNKTNSNVAYLPKQLPSWPRTNMLRAAFDFRHQFAEQQETSATKFRMCGNMRGVFAYRKLEPLQLPSSYRLIGFHYSLIKNTEQLSSRDWRSSTITSVFFLTCSTSSGGFTVKDIDWAVLQRSSQT